jgi:hypothetical protein
MMMRGVFYPFDATTATGFQIYSMLMEQYASKNLSNCWNNNIYSYLETSGANVIKLFTAVNYDFS